MRSNCCFNTYEKLIKQVTVLLLHRPRDIVNKAQRECPPSTSIRNPSNRGTVTTSAAFTAASNLYMVKVGGQSTILSPGSSTHLINRSISSSAPQPTCTTAFDYYSFRMINQSIDFMKTVHSLISSQPAHLTTNSRRDAKLLILGLDKCLGTASIPKIQGLQVAGHMGFHSHPTLQFPLAFGLVFSISLQKARSVYMVKASSNDL